MKKIYLLTTGLCVAMSVMAQSPGGVGTGLSLWIRADAAGTLNLTGNNVNSWTYFNNPSNSFTYAAGNQATFVANSLNSLPGVAFNGTLMLGPTGANAPISAGNEAYSIFAVWNTTSANSPQRPWTQWDSTSALAGTGASLWIFNPGAGLEWGEQPEIAPYTQGVAIPVTSGQYYVSELNLLNATSNDLELVYQNNLTAPTVLSTNNGTNARANMGTVTHQLGCRTNPTDEPYTGTLEELVIYNNSISAGASRNQIFSYLSMKYGIPLTGSVNLVSSAGATVWDATRGSGNFNNDVFGLAVDNGSGLSIQSSQASTTAGVGDAANIVLTPFFTFNTDQQFLMVGHDNGALTEETTDMPAYAVGSKRLIRNWFAQNAGSGGAVPPVNLSVDFTGVPVSGSSATDFRLMVSYSGDITFASPDALYTPTSFASNVASFSGVNLPDGSAFAFISSASGGTPLPVNFISFTAQANAGNVDLNWVVGNNQQASSYEVDRSSDGLNFTKVAVLPNEADETSYSFVDANPGAGTHFYRILETDENGQSIYSKVVSAAISGGDFSVAVLNNPAVGRTDAQVQINAVNSGVAFIELWTLDGKRMSLQQEAIGTGTTTISVPMSNLAPGSYVVKVMVNNNTHVTQVVKL